VTTRARETGKSLRDAALADEQIRSALSPGEIDHALDPLSYLGSTDQFIDRAIAEYQDARSLIGAR
jgi:adenylosuccinate lyase